MNGNILVRLIDCYAKGGQRTLCLGSMTINDNTSECYLPCPDNDIRRQNHGWWEQSAEEGGPLKEYILSLTVEYTDHLLIMGKVQCELSLQ